MIGENYRTVKSCTIQRVN